MEFDPDWVSHPCLTLLELLEQRQRTPAELAEAIGRDL